MALSINWLVVAAIMALVATTVSPASQIEAPWGTIRGVDVEGDGGRKMDGYLGIPYALPPVGDLRFEKPAPHPGPGEGKVFVADVVMPACIQPKGILVDASREYSEDCLKLNVFVPTDGTNSDTLYPVMFFIHGGAFNLGDATLYRPSRLVADSKVIVVVIQYRLGPFGFLSTGDGTLPGNQGLWDQNLALRWVKDNIRAFGGDPDLITVFGESAGSMSAGIHMMSPYSSRLMRRVIMQSGSPDIVATLANSVDVGAVFRHIADLSECKGTTSPELLQCLKKQEAEDILSRTAVFAQQSPLFSAFFPIIDGDFIPRDMKALLESEQYVKDNGIGDIDVMSGFNSHEGSVAIVLQMTTMQSTEVIFRPQGFQLFADACVFGLSGVRHPKAKAAATKAVEFFYRGADSFTDRELKGTEIIDMYGDCLLIAPAVDWTRRLAAMTHTANQYLYVVNHDFHFNKQGPLHGSHHADDAFLEFDFTIDEMGETIFKAMNKTAFHEEDAEVADKFVQLVTTFARTGDPSPPVRDDLGGGDWPQFTNENEAYLSISRSLHVQKDLGPYRDRTAVWTKLVPELAASVLKDETAQTGTGDDPQAGKEEL